MRTWLPPLLGFTNTSRGFMRGDGVGLMMKGLQRPSLETERGVRLVPALVDPHPVLRAPGAPVTITGGLDLTVGLAPEDDLTSHPVWGPQSPD